MKAGYYANFPRLHWSYAVKYKKQILCEWFCAIRDSLDVGCPMLFYGVQTFSWAIYNLVVLGDIQVLPLSSCRFIVCKYCKTDKQNRKYCTTAFRFKVVIISLSLWRKYVPNVLPDNIEKIGRQCLWLARWHNIYSFSFSAKVGNKSITVNYGFLVQQQLTWTTVQLFAISH